MKSSILLFTSFIVAIHATNNNLSQLQQVMINIGNIHQQQQTNAVKKTSSNTISQDICKVCEASATLLNSEIDLGGNVWSVVRDSVLNQCDDIPIELIQNECNYVMQYLDNIATRIEKGVEPNQVCQKLSLCPSKEPQQQTLMMNDFITIGNEQVFCNDCEAIMDKVHQSAIDLQKKWPQMVSSFNAQCKDLPTTQLQDACAQGVSVLDNLVTKTLNGVSTTDSCKYIGCQEDMNVVIGQQEIDLPEIDLNALMAEACDAVRHFVKDAEAKWPEFRQQLENQCKTLKDEAKMQTCIDLTARLNQVEQKLEDEVANLHICDKYQPHLTLSMMDSSSKLLIDIGSQEKFCHYCQEVSEFLEEKIENTATSWPKEKQEMIAKCNDLSCSMLRESCLSGVQVLDKIVSGIEENVDTNDMCASLGCQNEVLALLGTTPEPLCNACFAASGFAVDTGKKLQHNWPSVRQSVLETCNKIGQNELCQNIITSLDSIVNSVESKLASLVNMCDPLDCEEGPSMIEFVSVVQLLGTNDRASICESCESVNAMFHKYVDEARKNWPELKKQIAEQCAAIENEKLKQYCTQGLEQLDSIVTQALANVPEGDICSALGCNSFESLFEKLPRDENMKNEELCEVCHETAKEIVENMDDIEMKWRNALAWAHEHCASIENEAFEQKCINFVNTLDQIAQQLKGDTTKVPQLCEEFKLCPKPEVVVLLRGSVES